MKHRRLSRTFWIALLTFTLMGSQLELWVPAQTAVVHAADNGLAQKPLMGWSSYGQEVDHEGGGKWLTPANLKAQSDAMHEKLQSHGYEYINIDSGWNGGFDANGRPLPNEQLYRPADPNIPGDKGEFQELIDYIHANGQKVGLYTIPGIGREVYDAALPILGAEGCTTHDIAFPDRTGDYWNIGLKLDFSVVKNGIPCTKKYIESIADEFGEWGVDFIKFDSVTPGSGFNDTSIDARDDVQAWSEALSAHHIWLELSWALDHNYADLWKKWANGWRVDWDMECYCGVGTIHTVWPNIARLFPDAALWWRDAGPGGWNDFDSLYIGNGAKDGLTLEERRTAMTLYAISAAQLYIGDDMTKLDADGIAMLTNDEVIAINQSGHPAHPVSMDTNQQVWFANNGDGTYTVGLFNLGGNEAPITVNWSDLGLSGPAIVRDVWSHKNLGTFSDAFTASDVPSHGSRLLRITSNGGSLTGNDSDTNVVYTGDWQLRTGASFGQVGQPIAIDVRDSAHSNSAVAPATASFDKQDNNSTGVTASVTLNGNTLNTIVNGDSVLTAGTDYTVSGNDVTISPAYLQAQPLGLVKLSFIFSGGTRQPLVIAVSDSKTPESTVFFDRKATSLQDLSFTMLEDADFLDGIADGSGSLSVGKDFTVKDSTATLKPSYLVGVQTDSSALLQLHFSTGKTQLVHIRVIDSSKGSSVQLNDDDTGIVYSGSWGSSKNRTGFGDYNDDVHYAEDNGASFQYAFTGVGIELYTEKGDAQGELDVYLDDEPKVTVNGYQPNAAAQQIIFGVSGLTNGSHTIKVVKKSGKYAMVDKLRVVRGDLLDKGVDSFDLRSANQHDITSNLLPGAELNGISNGGITLAEGTDYTVSGSAVTIANSYLATQQPGVTKLDFQFDAGVTQTLEIAVIDSTPVQTVFINDDDASISYSGADWAYSSGRGGDYNGDVHYTVSTDDAVTYAFTGTGVELITGEDVSGGDIEVFIDDVSKGKVSAYRNSYDYLGKQKVFTISGLPNGQHTIKAVKVSGKFMILDGFNVIQPSGISPSTASFDKRTMGDIHVQLPDGSDALTAIIAGSSALQQGSDYELSGSEAIISSNYLVSVPAGVLDLTFLFASGKTEKLSVTVSDSTAYKTVIINDDDDAFVYTGGSWVDGDNRNNDYNNDAHYATGNGDYFDYTFTGTGVAMFTGNDRSGGDVDIYIDGVLKTTSTINNGSDTYAGQQQIFSITGLANGPHVIRAVKKSGTFFIFDKLHIFKPALIGPLQASFDKKPLRQQDIKLSIQGGQMLTDISNSGNPLVLGTDYTVNGSDVAINRSYLAGLNIGTVELTLSFGSENETLSINVTDTPYPVKNSDIVPAVGSFDKNAAAQQDLTIQLKLNGNTMSGITYDGGTLNPGSDYRVLGEQVVLTNEFLSALPAGPVELTLSFSGGAPKTYALVVVDTSDGATYTANDDDTGIAYEGKWSHGTGRKDFGDYRDDIHYSEQDGDSFEYAFTGTGIDFVTERSTGQGDMNIYVDGASQGTVNAYSKDYVGQQAVYSISGLTEGTHTLKVVKAGGSYLMLDKLTVHSGSLATVDSSVFDKAGDSGDLMITLSPNAGPLKGIANGNAKLVPGTDYSVNGQIVKVKKAYLLGLPTGKARLQLTFAGSFAEDVHAAEANGASFTYTFKGTGFQLLSDIGPDRGEMEIYVDGELKQTVDAASVTPTKQQTIYSLNGLEDRAHALKIVKKSGALLVLDRIVTSVASIPSTGAGAVIVTVKPSKEQVVTTADLKPSANGTIVVSVEDGADSVLLPVGVSGLIGNGTLTLKQHGYSLTFTREALASIASTSDADAQIRFTASKASDTESAKALEAANGEQGLRVGAISGVYAFGISLVTKDDAVIPVTSFKEPLTLSFNLASDTDTSLAGVYYIAPDGTLQYIGGKEESGVMTAQVGHFSRYAVLSYDKSFTDVTDDYWASTVIKQMAAKHIIEGVSETSFAPLVKVTRAQFASMLARALDLKGEPGTNFVDVDAKAWYAGSVAAVNDAGIVTGRSAKLFSPNDAISRQEMAVMIVRAYGVLSGMKQASAATGSSDFADSDAIHGWAKEAVQAARQLGLLDGRGGNRFEPQGIMNRAEGAQVIAKLLKQY